MPGRRVQPKADAVLAPEERPSRPETTKHSESNEIPIAASSARSIHYRVPRVCSITESVEAHGATSHVIVDCNVAILTQPEYGCLNLDL